MKYILISLSTLLVVFSCSNKQEIIQDVELHEPLKAPIIDTSKRATQNSKTISIHSVLDKLKKKETLSDKDFSAILIFLSTNNDEALSEEAGYTFYEYFKKNNKANLEFKKYLENSKDKGATLKSLIQIMCLDLGEDNYNSKKLQSDYPMFKGETEALTSFEECIGNE